MRHLFAILKDSFREALSGWILQAMMVLVGLAMLVVLSTSFRQLTLQEVMESRFSLLNTFVGSNPQFGSPKITIENATEANPSEPWASAHTFEMVITCPTVEDFGKAKKAGLPVDKKAVEQMMKSTKLFEGLTFEELVPAPATENLTDEQKKVSPAVARYRFTATGTTITEKLEWPHQLVVFFVVPVSKVFSFSPRDGVYYAENYLVNGVGGWIISLITVIITAAFVPNMMAKGALDLLIAKPIGRVWLLVCKYLGGLTYMVLLTTFTVLGMYLILGIRTGIWAPNFLAAIPLLTAQFAILYAVSTLVGVLTRNALVAILATVVAWFLFFAIGTVNGTIHEREKESKKLTEMLESGRVEEFDERGRRLNRDELVARFSPDRPLLGFIPASTAPIWRAVHILTPRTTELDDRVGRLIAQGVLTERQQKSRGWDEPPPSSWWELALVNGLFISAMLGLASVRFLTRDP